MIKKYIDRPIRSLDEEIKVSESFCFGLAKTGLAIFPSLSPNHDFDVGNSSDDLMGNLQITCVINFLLI
jgi:hypothetical protein